MNKDSTTGVIGTNPTTPVIPVNHNVSGTCGKCGGPVICPVFQTIGDTINEWCMYCGSKPKKPVNPNYGPIKEME